MGAALARVHLPERRASVGGGGWGGMSKVSAGVVAAPGLSLLLARDIVARCRAPPRTAATAVPPGVYATPVRPVRADGPVVPTPRSDAKRLLRAAQESSRGRLAPIPLGVEAPTGRLHPRSTPEESAP
jgi:hypothetical protein